MKVALGMLMFAATAGAWKCGDVYQDHRVAQTTLRQRENADEDVRIGYVSSRRDGELE